MNADQKKIERLNRLRSLVQSPGWKIDVLPYLQDEMKRGWEEFMALPVERKTGKMAYNHQARYQVLKAILAWIEDEIEDGEQAAGVEQRFARQPS